MYVLFLDDKRNPSYIDGKVDVGNTEVIIARSYDEFVHVIKDHGVPAFISFDHDLGEGLSGHDCVKWLIENQIVISHYFVHSANTVGAANIAGLMDSWIRFNSQP